MTNQFTFKTTRTHRPYYAASIRRRNKTPRFQFEHILTGMCPASAESGSRLAA
ncbi:MAG: hypothetical protein AAFZ10_12270 [Pseudomonadota bacterium]